MRTITAKPSLRINAAILRQLEEALRAARRENTTREINELFGANMRLRLYFETWVIQPLATAVREIKRNYLPVHVARYAASYAAAAEGGRLKPCTEGHPNCAPTERDGCSVGVAASYPAFAEIKSEIEEGAK